MTTTEPIDREALRERYRAERDKRLREDGNEQYIEVTGIFAEYVEDPYVQLSDSLTVKLGLISNCRVVSIPSKPVT